MSRLRIAAVAVATIAAAAFLTARGCGDADVPSYDRARDPGEAPVRPADDPAAKSSPSDPRRAARPVADAPAPATKTPSARPLKLAIRARASPEGTLLVGATVVIPELAGSPTALTDADGWAELDVPEGQHVAHVRSPGRTTTPVYTNCQKAVTAYEIDLPAGARLAGRVTDAGTGRPLAGVKVLLFDGGWADGNWWESPGKPFAELVSDEAGAIGIDGLATARPLTLESSHPGRARNRTGVFVAEPGVVRAEIAMEPGGCITGLVRRADGAPVAGVVVSAGAAVSRGDWVPGHAPLYAPTGADGVYRIEGLDLDGAYVVECYVSPDASASVAGVRPTAAVPEVRCDLTFAPTGTLRIELTGARAEEDDTAHVFTVLEGAHDTELGWLADGAVRELTPRRVRVEWNPEDGHPAIVREVEIRPGAETLVRIERPPVHRVVGRVVDADGRPRDGFELSLIRMVGDEKEAPFTWIKDDGAFEVEDVAAGLWLLEAEVPGLPAVRREIVVPCEPLVVVAPAPTSLRFRLPDGLDGAFVRWAVEAPVRGADGVPGWESLTSGTGPVDGEPLVEGPADWTGPTRLRVAVPGYLPFERIVDVEPGSHLDVVAGPLVPCRTLRGRVTDREGRPVVDAEVWCGESEPWDELRAHVSTEDDGRFSDLSVPPGPATLIVEAKGFADRRLLLAEDPAAALEIVLSRPGRLVVRVRDAHDVPAIARDVRVADAAGLDIDLPQPTRTDHRGRVELRVPPGRLRVTVGDSDPVAVDVVEDGTSTVDVVLR